METKKAAKVIIEAETVSQKEGGQTSPKAQKSHKKAPKVVNTYIPKRNAFYKLGYNENHIDN